jgi:hypothetical protein
MFAHVEVDDRAGQSSSLLRKLAWLRPAPSTLPIVERVLAIGPVHGPVDVGAGGGAWTVRLGKNAQPFDESGLTLGLRVACGLAIGELVKEALQPLGWVSFRLGDDLVWNLIDYGLRAAPTDSSAVTPRLPPDIAIAGVGSVGTSLVGALADDGDLGFGHISLIDPEVFDARNPYRYAALTEDVAGIAKVEWAVERLRPGGANIRGHQNEVAEWNRSRAAPGFDGVLIASPDTVDGRSQITDVLARDTITVGVSGLAFHVSHHRLGDGLACPYCQCVPLGPAHTQADVHAAQTGLAVERILQLMEPGAVLSEEDLAQVIAAARLSHSSGGDLVGHRLDDLVTRVYAEIAVPASKTNEPQVVLAAPHVSLIAGTLAAAELRKMQFGFQLLDRRIDLDLTGLPQGITRRPVWDTSGRCLCASPFRQRWMQQLYS